MEHYEQIANSDPGRELATKTRFNTFKPEWVPTEMWCGLLGDDVNNLRHMQHTYFLVQRAAETGKLDRETTEILSVTAATHDLGEAVIGDIPLPEKTHEDEREEEIAYRALAKTIFTEDPSDVVWSVLNKTDAERGDLFRAIEYVGYCTTALRAGRMATQLAHGFRELDITRDEREQLVGGLLGMERAVTIHNFPVMSGYVKKYPFLAHVIQTS